MNQPTVTKKKIAVAVTLALATMHAQATDIVGDTTVTASDPSGLNYAGAGDITVTVDSATEGSGLVLGQDNVSSVTKDMFSPIGNFTFDLRTSGTANGVIFAGDVTSDAADPNDNIIINAINDNVTFQGNVNGAIGAFAPIDINLGDSAADPTLSMTVDTANNEDLSINATIDAVDAGDTITLAVINSHGGANSVTFGQAIGRDVALDTINLGTATNVTFNDTVNVGSGSINFTGSAAALFRDDVTGNLVFASGNTAQASFGSDVSVSGNITTAALGQGTLNFAAPTADITLVSGTTGSFSTLNIATGPGLTSTFGGDVGAGSINVSGTGTLEFAGNAFGTLNLANDGLVNFNANRSLTGAVTTANNGQGSVTFDQTTADTTLVSGNLGSSGASLRAVTYDVGNGSTASFAGDVFANSIIMNGANGGAAIFSGNVGTNSLALTADQSLTFSGSNSFTGNIDTGTDNSGTVRFANGGNASMNGLLGDTSGNALKSLTVGSGTTADVVTFSGNIAAYNINVSNLAGFRTSRAITAKAQNGFTNNGLLQLADTLTLTGGGIAELAGSSLSSLQMLNSSYTGNTFINAAAMSTVNASNVIRVLPHAGFTSGSLTLLNTSDGAGTAYDASRYTVTDTMSTRYDISTDANFDVILTATAKSGGTDNLSLTQTLDSVRKRLGSELENNGNLAKEFIKETKQQNSAAADQGPEMMQGGWEASSRQYWAERNGDDSENQSIALGQSMDQSAQQTTTQERDDLLDSYEKKETKESTKELEEHLKKTNERQQQKESQGQRGANSGDAMADASYSVWAHVSAGEAEKNENQAGDHTTDISSLMMGVKKTYDRTHGLINLGLNFGYTDSDMDFATAAGDGSQSQGYMASVSGSHNLGERYYLFMDWSLGAGRMHTDTARLSSNGLAGRADYDSDLLFGDITFSVPLRLYAWGVLPSASLSWVSVASEGYTEHGAGSDNLRMGDSERETFTLKLGNKFTRSFALEDGTLSPSFTIAASYDFDDDAPTIDGGLASSPTVLRGQGEAPEQFGVDAGFGLGYRSDDGAHTVNFDYAGTFKDDYRRDTLSLSYGYRF